MMSLEGKNEEWIKEFEKKAIKLQKKFLSRDEKKMMLRLAKTFYKVYQYKKETFGLNEVETQSFKTLKKFVKTTGFLVKALPFEEVINN